MFSYDSGDKDNIISCNFDNVDLKEASAEDIFRVGSKWKDQSLLYSTVQAYTAATGW